MANTADPHGHPDWFTLWPDYNPVTHPNLRVGDVVTIQKVGWLRFRTNRLRRWLADKIRP